MVLTPNDLASAHFFDGIQPLAFPQFLEQAKLWPRSLLYAVPSSWNTLPSSFLHFLVIQIKCYLLSNPLLKAALSCFSCIALTGIYLLLTIYWLPPLRMLCTMVLPWEELCPLTVDPEHIIDIQSIFEQTTWVKSVRKVNFTSISYSKVLAKTTNYS